MCSKNTPQPEYQSDRHVVYSCNYHLVWCPKVRRPVLINGVDKRLKEIIRQTADEIPATVIELEITPALACGASVPDHICTGSKCRCVHLLCEIDPQFGVHRLVRRW